ncbi:hypothetical protein NDU88_007129, partial [Pleurodeles waltl]
MRPNRKNILRSNEDEPYMSAPSQTWLLSLSTFLNLPVNNALPLLHNFNNLLLQTKKEKIKHLQINPKMMEGWFDEECLKLKKTLSQALKNRHLNDSNEQHFYECR